MRGTRLGVVLALAASVGYVSADGTACPTPRGERGRCVSVRDCPSVLRIIAQIPVEGGVIIKPTPDTELGKQLEFVKQSRCKGADEYSVCCAYETEPGCGDFPESRIFNGNLSQIDGFPWTAIVQRTRDDRVEQTCGGSLLNRRYVLTAAGCLQAEASAVSVLLGEFDRTKVRDCEQFPGGGTDCTDPIVTVAVERAVPHPHYDASTATNDIALLRLADDVKYSDFVRPVCLSLASDFSTGPLRVSGWSLAPSSDEPTHTVKLQGCFKALSIEGCRQTFNGSEPDLCIGGIRIADVGGGAFARPTVSPSVYHVAAVAGARHAAVLKDDIRVYTRVHPHIDWIMSEIKR